jgi:hypothetical protein
VDDIWAGIAAAKGGEYDKAIRLFTKAIESGELSQEILIFSRESGRDLTLLDVF